MMVRTRQFWVTGLAIDFQPGPRVGTIQFRHNDAAGRSPASSRWEISLRFGCLSEGTRRWRLRQTEWEVEQMWQQLRAAAVVMGLLAGTAAAAYAQGTVTQDPGRATPGNLRSQQLGPSVDLPSGNIGAGEGTTVFQGTSRPGSTSRTMPGYGTNPGDIGAGTGAGFGGSSSGGLDRGIGPGR
jgi:hypothetical protein